MSWKSWGSVRLRNPCARACRHCREDEAHLLDAMGYAPVDIDSLCEQVDTSVEIISTLLLKLEIDGHISRLPGGLFQRLA